MLYFKDFFLMSEKAAIDRTFVSLIGGSNLKEKKLTKYYTGRYVKHFLNF